MRNALKWTGIAAGALVVVAGIVIAYIAATFNPNDYKAEIIKAVHDRTGRTLALKGEIKLSIFPTLGAKVGQASLSEPKSEREFASLTEALVAVKLVPLLSKNVIVDAIDVKGLRVLVSRDKSGKFNFDDLAGGDEKKKDGGKPVAMKIDIARIEVTDGDVTFTDEAAGTRYRLSKLNLKTGRVAEAVTIPIEFSAAVSSPKDKAQLDASLKARLTGDIGRQVYKLEGIEFAGKGAYSGFTSMNATAKGGVEARLVTGEYLANALAVSFTAKQAGAELAVKLDAPKVTLTRDKVEGGRVTIEAQRSDAGGRLAAKVTAGGVQGTFKAMRIAPLEASIDSSAGARTVKAALSGILDGNLEGRRFELAKLALTAKVTDPQHPKGAFDATINGAARADLAKGSAGLEFSGKLDESNVNGKAGVTAFSPLAVTFDLSADQLDVDRLLGRKPGGTATTAKPAADKGGAGAKDEKIDLSALKGVNAAGTVRIGRLTAFNVKSSDLRAELKVADGRLNLAPVTARLYDGALNGSLSAQAADNAVFAIRQTLTGVAVGPLLRDAADLDRLDGKGNVNLDITTRGASVGALKKGLNGTAAINLADGAIKGVDIAGTIRGARTRVQELAGRQVQPSNKAEKTDFTELRATFKIANGVAHNNDLAMKSPLLRLGGGGTIDIGNDRLDYLLKSTLVATSQGQGGRETTDLAGITIPIKITGTLDAPQWGFDFSGMVAGLAKQRVQDEILKRIPGQAPAGKGAKESGGVQDAIQDRLKGLFGR